MVEAPFIDTQAPNSRVLARGGFYFMKARLATEGGSTVSPDANTFTFANVVKILDPDGVDVTDDWVTNDLDTNDIGDVWDDANIQYVGEEYLPEYAGLFAESWDKTQGTVAARGALMTGRIAQKIQVPITAEITNTSEGRNYTILWELRVNGVIVETDDGSFSETFNVGPSATLDLGGGSVSTSEVLSGIDTSLDPATISSLLERATRRVRSMALGMCKSDINDDDPLDDGIRDAIITMTHILILHRDTSAGGIVNMRKQGTKQIRYSGDSGKLTASMMEEVKMLIGSYCKCKRNPIRFRTHRQTSGDGRWDPRDTTTDRDRDF